MSDQESPQAPAGWYPDPQAPGQQRYWDGNAWTDHTAPGPGSGPRVTGGGPPRVPEVQRADWQTADQERPSTWLWQSIVATVLCCLPAGIVAIVFAAQAQGALNSGDLVLAREKAGKARTWTLVSVAVGLLAALVWVALAASGTVSTEYWDFAGARG